MNKSIYFGIILVSNILFLGCHRADENLGGLLGIISSDTGALKNIVKIGSRGTNYRIDDGLAYADGMKISIHAYLYDGINFVSTINNDFDCPQSPACYYSTGSISGLEPAGDGMIGLFWNMSCTSYLMINQISKYDFPFYKRIQTEILSTNIPTEIPLEDSGDHPIRPELSGDGNLLYAYDNTQLLVVDQDLVVQTRINQPFKGSSNACAGVEGAFVVICGTTTCWGDQQTNLAVIRGYDGAGMTVWEKQFNDKYYDQARIIKSSATEYIAAFITRPTIGYVNGNDTLQLYGLDQEGTTIWSESRVCNSDLLKMISIGSGGFLLAGHMFVARFSSNGQTLWWKYLDFDHSVYEPFLTNIRLSQDESEIWFFGGVADSQISNLEVQGL